MIKIPHLYRVEAGPLGPAKRPPPPSPADNPVVEHWRAVDGKPHLEQNDRGQFRTKDFTNEANNPYPSVPDKNTIEPMRPYFDPAVDAQLLEESDEYDSLVDVDDPWGGIVQSIIAELPNAVGLTVLDAQLQRSALIAAGHGLAKYWSVSMLRSPGARPLAVNHGLGLAKTAYLRGLRGLPMTPVAEDTISGLQLLMRANEETVARQRTILRRYPLVKLTKEKADVAQRKAAKILGGYYEPYSDRNWRFQADPKPGYDYAL